MPRIKTKSVKRYPFYEQQTRETNIDFTKPDPHAPSDPFLRGLYTRIRSRQYINYVKKCDEEEEALKRLQGPVIFPEHILKMAAAKKQKPPVVKKATPPKKLIAQIPIVFKWSVQDTKTGEEVGKTNRSPNVSEETQEDNIPETQKNVPETPETPAINPNASVQQQLPGLPKPETENKPIDKIPQQRIIPDTPETPAINPDASVQPLPGLLKLPSENKTSNKIPEHNGADQPEKIPEKTTAEAIAQPKTVARTEKAPVAVSFVEPHKVQKVFAKKSVPQYHETLRPEKPIAGPSSLTVTSGCLTLEEAVKRSEVPLSSLKPVQVRPDTGKLLRMFQKSTVKLGSPPAPIRVPKTIKRPAATAPNSEKHLTIVRSQQQEKAGQRSHASIISPEHRLFEMGRTPKKSPEELMPPPPPKRAKARKTKVPNPKKDRKSKKTQKPPKINKPKKNNKGKKANPKGQKSVDLLTLMNSCCVLLTRIQVPIPTSTRAVPTASATSTSTTATVTVPIAQEVPVPEEVPFAEEPPAVQEVFNY